MQLLESALRQIIGYYPTYMRSPYFSANGLVLSIMAELGYKVVHADIDTLDWANNSPSTIQNSVQRFRNGLDNGGSIALAHDVHETTARVLTQAMIDEVRARGLRRTSRRLLLIHESVLVLLLTLQSCHHRRLSW